MCVGFIAMQAILFHVIYFCSDSVLVDWSRLVLIWSPLISRDLAGKVQLTVMAMHLSGSGHEDVWVIKSANRKFTENTY